MLDTAVLFLVYKRPDTTKRVFEVIRRARPSRLYIAGDGPRSEEDGETEKVQEARRIATSVDWGCEVKTLFRDENLGCKKAVNDAISWFFEYEDAGIILEDDILPSASFFPFMQTMLEMYKKDSRVMMVTGYNIKNQWKPIENSCYFFSMLGGIWGWASWRRAWEKRCHLEYLNDLEMIYKILFNSYCNKDVAENRVKNLLSVHEGLDTWDYEWGVIRALNSGLTIVPRVNLIKNIGFGYDATHTKSKHPPQFLMGEIQDQINHPRFVVPDRQYDLEFVRKNSIKHIPWYSKYLYLQGLFKKDDC